MGKFIKSNIHNLNSIPLVIGKQGWIKEIESDVVIIESPNFDARPESSIVDLLVLHNISIPLGSYGGGEIESLFVNRLNTSKKKFKSLHGLKVSAHFLIKRTGVIIQFVSICDRAWHAGSSRFLGKENCNNYSIGIELEGTDLEPFTEYQYCMLNKLIESISSFFPSVRHLTGHSFIAPGRKTDPGPFFKWDEIKNCSTLRKKNFIFHI